MIGREPQLRPGERVILSRGANLIIDSAHHGRAPIRGAFLRRFLMDDFGDESLGGRLTLTNQRLFYKTHPFNRVWTTLDIPLRSIRSSSDVSRGIARMVRVEWDDRSAVWVFWGVPRLVDAIELARNSPESIGPTA